MTSAQSIDAQDKAAAQVSDQPSRPFQIRACDECKRQKMKCSSIVDYPNPCKRCQNRRQPCEFTSKSERTRKREQKRKQSTQEGNQIRRSAMSPPLISPATDALRQSAPSDPYSAQGVMPYFNARQEPQTLHCPSELSVPYLSLKTSTAGSAIGNPVPRFLQGIEVSITEINETFSLFFTNYSHYLGPFLDPCLSPDQYFAESPLLFWTIVVIGSRQYLQNPTLLSSLAAPVLELVWKSMMQTNEYICPVIESLILLATWAFPLKTVFKDMTFAMSGMAMSLAIQIGYHVPKQAQAFALKTIDSSEISYTKRMNLWINCVLCRLRSAASLGYPSTTIELAKKILSAELSQFVPTETVFQLQIMDLAAQATITLSEKNDNTKDDSDHLIATLEILEAKFTDLESELVRFQDQERLHFHIARLQIRVYYLGTSTDYGFPARAAMLYQDSIAVIVICGKLQESTQLCSSCPTYIWLMLGLAACALLKLLRSRSPVLEKSISLSEGQQSYFAAIALLKRTSIEPDDGPGRLAGALTQLWTSRRVSEFTDAIGTNSSVGAQHSQSRLAMSLFYETLQWYRDEYGGQAFLASLLPRDSGLPHSAIPTAGTTLPQTDTSLLNDEINLDDPFFANWIPMTDDDFTAFGIFPSWQPSL